MNKLGFKKKKTPLTPMWALPLLKSSPQHLPDFLSKMTQPRLRMQVVMVHLESTTRMVSRLVNTGGSFYLQEVMSYNPSVDSLETKVESYNKWSIPLELLVADADEEEDDEFDCSSAEEEDDEEDEASNDDSFEEDNVPWRWKMMKMTMGCGGIWCCHQDGKNLGKYKYPGDYHGAPYTNA
ncbi:hypothetical protein P691DRAFT_854931 [Macrolepiota fuliginosa MF-IS2]|uniref:Uncharacterized protein n=1 Tax=Macrolepiota fuliginosa MF-IS2 TaxID=1400762 RepID=A0A9P5WZE0_9AGAR|nr:hypothetical protein P691DRAFT_854931 [Macrolepiota fuliginosa MF-IS2]